MASEPGLNGGVLKPSQTRSDVSAKPHVSIYFKIFFFFHLACITIWALPEPPAAVRSKEVEPRGSDWLLLANADHLKTNSIVETYVLSTGIWQYWDMFSPDPAQVDFYGDAEVVYRDGSVKTYAYPRMADLPIAFKGPKERYRKFFERVREDKASRLWPTFGYRIALLNYSNRLNPPTIVRLKRHWLPVAAPGDVQEKKYHNYIFFEYVVDQGLLAKDGPQT